MKLWLSKNLEVSMRDQLVTQITIGVASGDLLVGEKLPSRGEISRRFGIHENTVSNAYKELAKKGLIVFKQGSGFYVCDAQNEDFETKQDINSLTLEFLRNSKKLGYSNKEITDTLNKLIKSESTKELLIIENDAKLREILIDEIEQKTKVKTLGISFDEFKFEVERLDSVFVALSDEEEKVQKVLPVGKSCIYLKAQSVPSAMAGEARPSYDSLIAVVSGWDTFLLMAKTILVAAKVNVDSIVVRSTEDENWRRGLENVDMIICDSLTTKKLPDEKRVRPFPLVAESSIERLRKIVNFS